jgi:hypothetical protein
MAGGFAEGPAAKLTLHQVALVLGMLCTGCINNLVKKYAYDTSSTGAKFRKKYRGLGTVDVFVRPFARNAAGLHGVTHKFAKVCIWRGCLH